MIEKDLIQALRKKDRKGQKYLYEQYAPKFFGMLKRYLKRTEDIEDTLVEGFFKIMTNIHQYTGKGNFEGWMRR
ncbi:MAG: sigma factor, partial [Bacteroidota bacterium]